MSLKITDKQIEELNRKDKIIQMLAKKFGLDFYPQEFDIISSEKMAEILGYGFPVTYHHWSGGRDYELQKTLWRFNRTKLPMEVVFPTNPSRAYLCETDPFVVLVLTMAHVYGHNDFFKNNYWAKTSRTDMNRYLAGAHERFEEYGKEFGIEAVEKVITAARAIKFNIDPFIKERPDFSEEIERRIKEAKKKDPKINVKKLRQDFQKQIPFEPDRDLIGFIAENAPELEPWQRDILWVVREEVHCQFPIIRTKIMNEGWAVFWHEKIMEELIKAQMTEKEDREIYMRTQSRVLASHPLGFNPYLIGREIWKYIEKKYGKEKLFQVRASYRDIEFIDEFLTNELIHEMKLYIYAPIEDFDEEGEPTIFYVIVEKRPKIIREIIVQNLKETPSAPIINVLKSNYNSREELYLHHQFNEDKLIFSLENFLDLAELELDEEYREKTMEHIWELWGRTVWLESKEETEDGMRPVVFSFNGKEHKMHTNNKKK